MSGGAASAGDALALALAAFFAGRGYEAVEAPMLIPADIVLDHMGEDIRRRLLLTTAPDGRELCLRPDFTLPVALRHVAGGAAAKARYSYSGIAFRFPAAADPLRRTPEFRQVGIEDYGEENTAAADAGVLEAAVAALAEAGLADVEITLGDVAVFATLVDGLGLSAAWAARLKRLFWRRLETAGIVASLREAAGSGPEVDQSGIGRALSGMDRETARAMVGEMMALAGTGLAAGRSADEIAARFVDKAAAGRDRAPSAETADLIEAYLSIMGPPAQAIAAIAELAAAAGIDLGPAVEALERRLALIEARGVDLRAARFATAFGRRIEYYTGHVFEVRASGGAEIGPIAGGGRYDGFLSVLGAPSPIPAVGCSVYVDRLAAVVSKSP